MYYRFLLFEYFFFSSIKRYSLNKNLLLSLSNLHYTTLIFYFNPWIVPTIIFMSKILTLIISCNIEFFFQLWLHFIKTDLLCWINRWDQHYIIIVNLGLNSCLLHFFANWTRIFVQVFTGSVSEFGLLVKVILFLAGRLLGGGGRAP